VLSQCANASALLAGQHLVWRAPQSEKPAPAPKPTPAPQSVTPRDVIAECRATLDAVCAKRSISRYDAIDLIDPAIHQRALGEYARADKLTMSGGFGSKQLVRSGAEIPGVTRRCTDGFDVFICSDRTLASLAPQRDAA
jgi:hypothetical protein